MDVPVIISERVDPTVWRDIQPWQAMRDITLRFANVVVSQTLTVADVMKRIVGERSVAIANPVPAAPPCERRKSGTRLVSCGRLTESKGFDRLIEAFHLLSGNFPAWSLTIAGEGELRPKLETLIAEFGLSGRVSLPGAFRDSREVFEEADIFVLSSRYEGFPNVLTEAMAYGIPVVSFDCRSGPAEIIRNDFDGFLVPAGDVAALAGTLERLMSDEAIRLRVGRNAVHVSERFSMSRILYQWDHVFAKVGIALPRKRERESSDVRSVSSGRL
jgi:glycosyltransferase involved in cell wall biosynthesis